jgi:hypothetical protein
VTHDDSGAEEGKGRSLTSEKECGVQLNALSKKNG